MVILGDHPREGHGLVITQRHVAAAVVPKTVDQFLRFGAVAAKQHVGVFERRRLQRLVAPALEDVAQPLLQPLPLGGLLRQVIVEAFQRAGLNAAVTHDAVSISALYSQSPYTFSRAREGEPGA